MKIVLTGGGTAGHIIVNQLLIPPLRDRGHTLVYIGSKRGMEKERIARQGLADYHGIQTGKLRRYFDLQNLLDFFRVWAGIFQALMLLHREKPDVIFSAGGYVTVPVMVAGRLLGIPSLIRETDCSMGLANRICARFAGKVYATFPGTLAEYDSEYCGIIVRPELLEGRGGRPAPFQDGRPVILVLGGSLGAEKLNRAIWDSLDRLTERYNIVLACGKGKRNPQVPDSDRYRQYEFIEDMAYFYAASDAVVTRSGSNAVCECLALGKRMLCVPLARNSRGEQVENARFAVDSGCALTADDDALTAETLLRKLEAVLAMPESRAFALDGEQLRQNCARLVEGIERAGGLQ